jgi:hypothetical protein
MSFFLLVFSLSVEVLLEINPNEFNFGDFPYLVFLLSVDSLLEADPIEF